MLIFFFNNTATTEFYTYLHPLSLHYAFPISLRSPFWADRECRAANRIPWPFSSDIFRFRSANAWKPAAAQQTPPNCSQAAVRALPARPPCSSGDWKSAVSGKSGSVSVDLGGWRLLKNKTEHTLNSERIHHTKSHRHIN